MTTLQQDVLLVIAIAIVIALSMLAVLAIRQIRSWKAWMRKRDEERRRAARLREQIWERDDELKRRKYA
jgi:hypothetical protein